MPSFTNLVASYLSTSHSPPKNDLLSLMERGCYYAVDSSESDEETLSTLSGQDYSVKTSSSNEKVADVLKKHKKINQEPQERGAFRKRSFCTVS